MDLKNFLLVLSANDPFVFRNITETLYLTQSNVTGSFSYAKFDASSRDPDAAARVAAQLSCIRFFDGNSEPTCSNTTKVCGAEWVPPGGLIGDLSKDELLPSARRWGSVIFRMPPSIVKRFKEPNVDYNFCVETPSAIKAGGKVRLINSSYEINRKNIHVPVRAFLKPGWKFIVDNVIIKDEELRPRIVSLKTQNCNGLYDSLAYATAVAGKDGTFTFASMSRDSMSLLTRWRYYASHRRRVPRSKEPPFGGRKLLVDEGESVILELQMCYYDTPNERQGVPIGTVTFSPDKADSCELVAFVVFSMIGAPFLIGLTVGLYAYKHRQLRKNVRRMRLALRREEIEQILLDHFGPII